MQCNAVGLQFNN